jgi:hypothetical protein
MPPTSAPLKFLSGAIALCFGWGHLEVTRLTRDLNPRRKVAYEAYEIEQSVLGSLRPPAPGGSSQEETPPVLG